MLRIKLEQERLEEEKRKAEEAAEAERIILEEEARLAAEIERIRLEEEERLAEEARIAQEIAEKKMPDLNCASIESAMSMIEGSARAMGLQVVE